MEAQINPQEIMQKLVYLQTQINSLREDFEDTQLTEEEIKLIDESLVNEREGKLISSKELRRELGV